MAVGRMLREVFHMVIKVYMDNFQRTAHHSGNFEQREQDDSEPAIEGGARSLTATPYMHIQGVLTFDIRLNSTLS